MASGSQHKKYSVPNASGSRGYVNYGANSSVITNGIKSNSLPANASLLHLQYDPQTIEPDIDSLFSTKIPVSKNKDLSKSPLKTLEQAFLSLKNPDRSRSKELVKSPLKDRRRSKTKDHGRKSLDGSEQDCEALLSIEAETLKEHSQNVQDLFAIKNCARDHDGSTRHRKDFLAKTNFGHPSDLYRMPQQNFEPDPVFSSKILKDQSSSSDDFETPLLSDQKLDSDNIDLKNLKSPRKLSKNNKLAETKRPPSGKNSGRYTKNSKTTCVDSKTDPQKSLRSSFNNKVGSSQHVARSDVKIPKPSADSKSNSKITKPKSDAKVEQSKIPKNVTKNESKISTKLDLKSTFLKTDLRYKKCNLKDYDDSKTHSRKTSLSNGTSSDGKAGGDIQENRVIEFLEVAPQTFAEQITLLDLPSFTAIQAEELTSCAWNSRNKLNVAPNVVAFTRRFNNVSFWTVSEVLAGPTPKKRSEHISHFVKIARHLHSLNNLHALFAVISGLQSASIHRLDKSWNLVQKKDKLTFEKLASVFSEKENWKVLREYQDSLRLPCIPYLGLFLTDFVYIDMSQPASQRSRKMDNILRVIALYQQSRYDELKVDQAVQKYLERVKYIEELQRFLEDDQYKLSLKLEPPASSTMQQNKKNTESTDSNIDANGDLQKSSQLSNNMIQEQTRNMASLNLSPAKAKTKPTTNNTNNPTSTTTSGSLRISNPVAKFIPGHRKCRSLGTNIFYKTNQPSLNPNGSTESTNASVEAIEQYNSRHLLDDSLLEDSKKPEMQSRMCESLGRNFTPGNVNGKYWGSSGLTSSSSKDSNTYREHSDITAIHEGFVRRKTVLREHRKTPLVTQWQRFWMQLSADSLHYYAAKSFKGNDRPDFKRDPQKSTLLLGWTVNEIQDQSSNRDDSSEDLAFELVNRIEAKYLENGA
ncbi:ras-specific guanine nucleotide-releasing factor RalGPS2-like isoform X2 [Ctenocephalides felis]|uniref:ras-specific guanine nucleotide-releasing factor RalGPS2-like isoform X2 n=1 Tax=Ctenocephalides felis TaxID=7515 RepID=UPI000E6E39E9|nr:ras-specific guanine nucleotide-releasing factor RalGPS2-like isoform X2 [Ctenocephalides felis]